MRVTKKELEESMHRAGSVRSKHHTGVRFIIHGTSPPTPCLPPSAAEKADARASRRMQKKARKANRRGHRA